MKKCPAAIQIATLVLALVMVSIPSLAQAGATNSQARAQRNDGSAPREQSSGAPHEGIKVHGHWTIVVHNKDGSVASRDEFENALVTGAAGGGLLLTSVLSRQITLGYWAIQLGGSPTPYVASPS